MQQLDLTSIPDEAKANVVDDDSGKVIGVAFRADQLGAVLQANEPKKPYDPSDPDTYDMSGTQPEPEVAKKKTADLVNRSVFVSIKIGRPGNHRKVDSSLVTFNDTGVTARPYEDLDLPADGVDRSFVGINKKLIDCPEYKKIGRGDGLFKKLVGKRCAASGFRSAVFILPNKLIPEVDAEYEKRRAERLEEIAAYKAVYLTRVEEALGRLGPIGNRADYPPWSAVEKLFTFELQYITLGTPVVLGNVNQAIFEREQQKFEAQCVSALDEMKAGLRVQMAELVEHMVDRLQGDREASCKACNATGENRIPCTYCSEGKRWNQVISDPSDQGNWIDCQSCEGKGYNSSTCEKCEGKGKWIEEGKPKKFNSTLVDNMNDFLKVFDARNLADDAELADLVSQARSLLGDSDTKKIKKDGDLRADIAAGFSAIKAQLDTMVVEKQTRAIRFDD